MRPQYRRRMMKDDSSVGYDSVRALRKPGYEVRLI
jgi:hypothetical protein